MFQGNNNENEFEETTGTNNMRKKRLDSTVSRTQATEISKDFVEEPSRKFPTRSRKKSNRPRVVISSFACIF
jgi:hypothetical protein